MSGAAWTKAEIAQLEGMSSLGYSIAEISKILGRSYDAITTKRRELGLATRERVYSLSRRDLKAMGVNMGSLRDELSPAMQLKIARLAKLQGLTVAGAIAEILEG